MTDERLVECVAEKRVYAPFIPIKVIERNGHLLLELHMSRMGPEKKMTYDFFGVHLGRIDDMVADMVGQPIYQAGKGKVGEVDEALARERIESRLGYLRDARGFSRGASKSDVPEGNLTGAEAYLIAQELGLRPVSFGEYVRDLRCSDAWITSHHAMHQQRRGLAAHEKRQRPSLVEIIKGTAQVHTDSFVIDARFSDTVVFGQYIVDAKKLGIEGQLVVVPYGEGSEPNIQIKKIVSVQIGKEENTRSQNLYSVKSINNIQVIDLTDFFGAPGKFGKERIGLNSVGHYEVREDRTVDFTRREHQRLRGGEYNKIVNEQGINGAIARAKQDMYHVVAHFEPGYVGPIATGGYFSARINPSLTMQNVKGNLIVRLPSK
jgi:hypothetical protein